MYNTDAVSNENRWQTHVLTNDICIMCTRNVMSSSVSVIWSLSSITNTVIHPVSTTSNDAVHRVYTV